MKNKISFLTAMFLFAVVAIDAQNNPREEIALGGKLGINISNVWDSNNDEFRADSKVGFAGGVFLGIPIGEFMGFQPELLFSQKGFNGEGTLLGSSYSFKRTKSYVDIPLQLQIKPSDYLTLLAGPQFSYLISQTDKYTFGDNSTEQKQEFDNDKLTKNILGFVFGADLYYQQFIMSGRVGWDFQNNKGDGTSTTPRYKNKWLQFTVGFKI